MRAFLKLPYVQRHWLSLAPDLIISFKDRTMTPLETLSTCYFDARVTHYHDDRLKHWKRDT